MKTKRKISWPIIIIIVVALVLVMFFGYNKFSIANKESARKAVFLSNGQVYFGYLESEDRDYLVLRDIYYLRSVESANEGKISLVKLGSEVYGPEDWMTINREHVLYLEDMRTNSKIAEAIKNNSKK